MTADYAGRMPDGVAHQMKAGRLDRADWPYQGDEVLYRDPSSGCWHAAVVLSVAEHDGDLTLDTGAGPDFAAIDSKHGTGLHCWLLYREASEALR